MVECGLVNSRGEIAWSKIARWFEVSTKTLDRWKDPMSKYYHRDFHEAFLAAQEALEVGQVKLAVIDRAKGFTQVKTVREPVLVGPSAPPLSSLGKPELTEYGKRFGLRLKRSMSKGAMILAIKD